MISTDIKEFANNIDDEGSILCLDFGSAKIGIAMSDTSRIIANAKEVYIRRNISKDIGYLAKYMQDNNIKCVVIGLPLSLDGSEGANCEKVRNFAGKIIKKTGLPVFLKDERMSTAEASRVLSESGMTRKKRDAIDDKTAASIILQSVLDSLEYLGRSN